MGRKEKFDNDEFDNLKNQIYDENEYFKDVNTITEEDKIKLERLKKKLKENGKVRLY